MTLEVWVAPAMHLRRGGRELHALGTPFQQNDLELTLPREVLSCQKKMGEEGGGMARLRGGMARRLARAKAICKAGTQLDAILRRRVRLTVGEDLNRINRSEVDVTVHDVLYAIGGRRRRASSRCSWP